MSSEIKKIKKIIQLSFSLAKVQIKLRNEGSYFGILWYLLEPLAFFSILFFLGSFLLNNSIEKYPVYLFLGLMMFNFFLATTNACIKVFHFNSGFIKSIKINKHSLVVATILQYAVSHFFEVIIFLGFLIYFKISLVGFLFYPLIFLFFALFVLGLCFILSVIGVYVVDFNNIWQIFSRLLWFVTPIFYLLLKGSKLYYLSLLNPVYYFIDISREIIIYNRMPAPFYIVIAVFCSILFLVLGIIIFNKSEKKIAERL
jgi:ABC-type polysaccharide/polyol phosphate export permease